MGPGGALMAQDGIFMYRLLNDPGVRPGRSENKAPAAIPLRGLFSSSHWTNKPQTPRYWSLKGHMLVSPPKSSRWKTIQGFPPDSDLQAQASPGQGCCPRGLQPHPPGAQAGIPTCEMGMQPPMGQSQDPSAHHKAPPTQGVAAV